MLRMDLNLREKMSECEQKNDSSETAVLIIVKLLNKGGTRNIEVYVLML